MQGRLLPEGSPPIIASTAPEWKPPWPPIQVSEHEWIIVREKKTQPTAVIRRLRLGPRSETFYRVVTWAPTAEGRELVGYYASLDEANRSVKFTPLNPVMPDIRTASGWGGSRDTRPAHEVSPGKANSPARTERD